MINWREGPSDRPTMAESQISELQNMQVLLEEARGLSRNLAYHRRARLEARIGEALEEVDLQIQELRATKGYSRLLTASDALACTSPILPTRLWLTPAPPTRRMTSHLTLLSDPMIEAGAPGRCVVQAHCEGHCARCSGGTHACTTGTPIPLISIRFLLEKQRGPGPLAASALPVHLFTRVRGRGMLRRSDAASCISRAYRVGF